MKKAKKTTSIIGKVQWNVMKVAERCSSWRKDASWKVLNVLVMLWHTFNISGIVADFAYYEQKN